MITRPNKLYFRETFVKGPNDGKKEKTKKQYFWTLVSSNGKIIGSSSELYSKKVYVLRNVITLFGMEIEAGVHVILDEEDHQKFLVEKTRRTGG